MKMLPFLFIFYSVSSLANCVVSTNGQRIRFQNSVSLFDKGKSLENHATQDQDGVGFCYANATSVVLKSVLPGNPDLSYVHGALQASTLGPGKNWATGNDYVYQSEGSANEVSFVEGGNVCNTIAALKKSGGACSKNGSILESKQLLSPELQKKIFLHLGKYFDKYKGAMLEGKIEKKEIKESISLMLEEFQFAKHELIRECEEQKKDIPVERALRIILEKELLSLNTTDKCDEARRENIRRFVSPQSKITKDMTLVFLTPSVAKELVASLSRDVKFYSELQKFLSDKNPDLQVKEILTQRLAPEISSFFENLLPKLDSKCANASPLKTPKEEMAKILINAMAFQKQNPCQKLISNVEVAGVLSNPNCTEPVATDTFLNAILPLLAVGASTQELAQKLTNPNATYGDQIKQILTPGCEQKNNIVPVHNVTCETRSTCNSTTKKCGNEDIIKEVFKTSVYEGIKEGRALGIIFCTGVLKDPNVRSGFCQKPIDGIEGHTNHVVAVSGYRCENGKVEYEIANSWGKSCPVSEKEGYKNSSIKCVLGSDGKPTGRFFMSEDALVSNLLDFNIVKAKQEKKK